MHIDKPTIIDPVMTGYEMDPCKQGLSFYDESSFGPRAQIMYATGGLMKVTTPTHLWMVMPSQAIWIPGGETHEVITRDRVQHIFFDTPATSQLPDTGFAFETNTFFRELLQRITQFKNQHALTECEYRIVQVLLDEINAMEPAALNLPLGKDERVQKITGQLLDMRIEAAAAFVHMSVRNFSKLFESETGLAYSDWCLKLKLLEAISRLQAGQNISQVAIDMGYESTSAFTYMFNELLGKPPCLFLHQQNGL